MPGVLPRNLSGAGPPPSPTPGTPAGFCTCHLTPWVRGGTGPASKHQGGGGWECGGRATPGTHPSPGENCRLAPQVCCLGMEKRFSAPPPSRSTARAYPRPGAGSVGAGRGGAAGASLQCIILWPGQRGAGRFIHTMRPAPRALRSGSTARSRSSALAASPRPGPLPARGGQGCGAGGTVTALSARGASTGRSVQLRFEPASAQPAAGFRVGKGDAARAQAPALARAPGRPLTAPQPGLPRPRRRRRFGNNGRGSRPTEAQ